MSEERKHSILAPSSKEWVHCGFSAKFLANKEEETNDASEFGTECHALAEAYIKQSLKIDDFDEGPVSIDELKSSFRHYDEEMETLATGYANFQALHLLLSTYFSNLSFKFNLQLFFIFWMVVTKSKSFSPVLYTYYII